MNIYKPPSSNEIYNPVDTIDNNNDDDDNENHLNVSGDEMEGRLFIKKDIQFKDFSIQETAFTSVKNDQIITNKNNINQNIIDIQRNTYFRENSIFLNTA